MGSEGKRNMKKGSQSQRAKDWETKIQRDRRRERELLTERGNRGRAE